MAAMIGNLGPFDKKSEKFSDYADRFGAYIAANGIDDDKEVNFLSGCYWSRRLQVVEKFVRSRQSEYKRRTRLTQLLQGHYELALIVIAERHTFWTASQGESESVSEFFVRLKKFPSTCSFGEFLSQAPIDRLVSGLHSKMSRTQRHLLSIRDLTYVIAYDKCVADEMAGKANREHMGESATGEASKVQDVPSFRG